MISSADAPTIFSSQVDEDMVKALESMGNVSASPEIFSFSNWNGVSFVLRGVDMDRLNATGPAFEKFVLLDDRPVKDSASAMVGTRLLDRLALALPYTLPVVGSYSSKLEMLNLIGWFETGTSLDDEMLVSMDSARHLSGMPDGKVSVIRVTAEHPEWLSGLLSPKGARFTLYDMHTSAAAVATNESIGISVGVRNWGGSRGTAVISFFHYHNKTLLGRVPVVLNGSSSTIVSMSFSFAQTGSYAIGLNVTDKMSTTYVATFSVVAPYLAIASPSKAMTGTEFNVTVWESSGNPASGATVHFRDQTVVADEQGVAVLSAGATEGSYEVRAELDGYTEAVDDILVEDISLLPDQFLPVIKTLYHSPDEIKETESVSVMVVFENQGRLPGYYEPEVLLDGEQYLTLDISLGPAEEKSAVFSVEDLSAGTHTIQVGPHTFDVIVEPWYASDPEFVELIVRYGSSSLLSSSSSIPIYQAAKISEGNIAVALFAVGAISALLSALAVTSVFSKEIHEGRRRLGILKTIGASRSAIRRIVFPQALESALGGAAIGVAIGVVVADWLSKSGLLVLFGHEFSLDLDTGLLVLALLGAVLISVSSALASAMLATKETTIKSIRRLPEEAGEPVDLDEILGDD